MREKESERRQMDVGGERQMDEGADSQKVGESIECEGKAMRERVYYDQLPRSHSIAGVLGTFLYLEE